MLNNELISSNRPSHLYTAILAFYYQCRYILLRFKINLSEREGALFESSCSTGTLYGHIAHHIRLPFELSTSNNTPMHAPQLNDTILRAHLTEVQQYCMALPKFSRHDLTVSNTICCHRVSDIGHLASKPSDPAAPL